MTTLCGGVKFFQPISICPGTEPPKSDPSEQEESDGSESFLILNLTSYRVFRLYRKSERVVPFLSGAATASHTGNRANKSAHEISCPTLEQPMCIAAAGSDAPGCYYIGCRSSLWYCNGRTGSASRVAGNSTIPGMEDGSGDVALFSTITGLLVRASEGEGDVLLCDAQNGRIRRFDTKTGRVSTLICDGGVTITGKGKGSSSGGVISSRVSLLYPSSLCLDRSPTAKPNSGLWIGSCCAIQRYSLLTGMQHICTHTTRRIINTRCCDAAVVFSQVH